MPWAPRFTTRQWLVGVGLVAYSLALGRALDVVLGWFSALLIACYVLSSGLSFRWQARSACVSFGFALLTWVRLGDRSLVSAFHPSVRFPPITSAFGLPDWLSWAYWMAKLPVAFAAELSWEIYEVTCFQRSGRIEPRPEMVLAFWSGVAMMFAVPLVSSLIARRKRKQSLPAP